MNNLLIPLLILENRPAILMIHTIFLESDKHRSVSYSRFHGELLQSCNEHTSPISEWSGSKHNFLRCMYVVRVELATYKNSLTTWNRVS